MTTGIESEQADDGQDSSRTAASGEAEGALTMKALEAAVGKATFEQRGDESSGSSSSAGQTGSRGGYSADYSSSDNSSDRSLQGKGFHMLIDKLTPKARTHDKSGSKKASDGPTNGIESAQNAQGKGELPGLSMAYSQNIQSLSDAFQKSVTGQASLPPLAPSAAPLAPQGPMPQWNGVRIEHPMDPRIDISTVGHIPTGLDPGIPALAPDIPALAPTTGVPDPTNSIPTASVFPPSLDHYLHLLEAVRPFFSAYGSHMQRPPADEGNAQQNGGSGSDAVSSEGFTSFFTTTNSNPTSSDSNSDKNQKRAEAPAAASGVAKAAAEADPASKASADDSDNSSMVVLARVKRKHLKRQADQSTNSSSSTSSEGRKEREEPQQRRNNVNATETARQQPESRAPHGPPPPPVAPLAEAQQENSSNSSSEDRAGNVAPQAPILAAPQAPLHMQQQNIGMGEAGMHQYPLPPRVVSESSDRNSSSQASNVMVASTTSGSGSAGNGGSANGSSGSGNEGKGSSTENAKSENSGGDLNSNSDNGSKENELIAENLDALERQTAEVSPVKAALHHHGPPAPETSTVQPPTVSFKPPIHPQKSDEHDAVREKKLLNKKRKRMNMRREYEEQVKEQMGSSESSQSESDIFLRPGKPVTLDEILCFTKTARLVVQATPPFLVVHANAAYTALSGIECHAAIGKPISALMSIPDAERRPTGGGEVMSSISGGESLLHRNDMSSPQAPSQGGNQVSETNVAQAHAAAEAAGHARATSNGDSYDMCLERLVATSGLGRHHLINVTAKPPQLLLGRNVTVVHEDNLSPENRKGGGSRNQNSPDEQVSQSSTIPSTDGHMAFVTCRMGISPVVSSPDSMDYTVVTDKDQDIHHHHGAATSGKYHSLKRGDGGACPNSPSSKRRKHHHNSGQDVHFLSSRAHHRRMLIMKDTNRSLAHNNTITHYVIQLEIVNGGEEPQHSAESLSSKSASTTMEARVYGLSKAEVKRRRIATMNGGDVAAGGEVSAPQDTIASREPQQEPQDIQEDEQANGDDLDVASEDSDPKEPVSTCG